MRKLISFVLPAYNEEANILSIYKELQAVAGELAGQYDHEIIFVNDGSTDRTGELIEELMKGDPFVRYIEFSRNFGKESATSAGLHAAKGDAVIILDSDLQHPPQLISELLAKWKNGGEVVVGVRQSSGHAGGMKIGGSVLFYALMRVIGETDLIPGGTDFRLLDRKVVEAFKKFTERDRLTRGLIDWLGFRREKVFFEAPPRAGGVAGYNRAKLVKLAVSSFVAHSLFPLRIAGYLGTIITSLSGLMGLFIFFEKYVFKDAWQFRFSGPAILAVINLFLVGIVLMCLGLIALYVASIQREVVNRPLYVIRKQENVDG